MAHEVDGVVQGNQPSNVIPVAFGRKTTDGGKARIRSRREKMGLSSPRDDLKMDHADLADYMPSEYCAPPHDCA
jgi:hypothetical protein